MIVSCCVLEWCSLPRMRGVAGEAGCAGLQPCVSEHPGEAVQKSMTQALKHLGRGHVILISFFVLNRKGVCG